MPEKQRKKKFKNKPNFEKRTVWGRWNELKSLV